MNEEMNNEMMEMDNIPAEEGVSSGNYLTTAVAGIIGVAIGAGAMALAKKRKQKMTEDDKPAKERAWKPFWKRKEKKSEPDIVIVDDSDVQ